MYRKQMKFRAFLIAVAAFALMACQEKVTPSVTVDDPSLTNLSYTCLFEKKQVPVTASMDWTASASERWITVSPTRGGKGSQTLTVSVLENGPDGERTGTVQVTCGTAVLTINVTQAEKASLQLPTSRLEVAQEGGEVSFQVISNMAFSTKVDEGADWISIIDTKSLNTSSVTLSVRPNSSSNPRTGMVTVTARNGMNAMVTVVQTGGKDKRFDESAIIASFGVMSDVHIQSGNNAPTDKFKSALSQLKTRAAVSDKDGLDGILIAGDMIQTGCSTTEITAFRDAYKSALDPSAVPLVYCLGNHDVTSWWTTNMVRDGKTFRSIYGPEFYGADVDIENGEALECRHARIRGVNILTISPIGNTPVRFDSRAMSWLDSKLAEITAADPESYVFILLHAMIQNTVYGSNLVSAGYESSDVNVASYWYTSALTSILGKYPQAVIFGGHLHFPINHPGSIWQGGFTALGCGSVRYMAFEGGSYYVNKSSGTVLNDSNDFSQGYLLQIDASGNARLTRMDFFHNQTIGDAWELSFPDAEGKSHLDAYSYARRVAENQAPVLGSFEVVPVSTSQVSVPCTAKWSAAQDEEFAHHYELTWTSQSGSNTVWIMSDYYLCPKPADMRKTWDYSLGSFPAGTYSATLVAVDPWGKSSAPATVQFTVQKESPIDPGTLPSAYADLAFDGTMRDVNGKVSVTNYGGSVTTANITVGGVSRSVPAFVTTSNTSYALCQFKEFTSAESMKSLMAGGFTVEAFYVDKDKSDGQTHGVVCGTEYGGWGLAESADRKPYFIVGDGARNVYKSVYATSSVSASELTHVVAAYDPSASKIAIYINGALQATSSFSSTFFPGEGDAFNRFCLGADVTNGNKGTHYPSTSMVIADAKIYTTALNATQAALAFDKAKKDLGF